MNDKPKKLEFNTSHEVGTTATDEDLQSKCSRPSSRGAGSSKMIESRFDHAEDVVVRWHLGYSKRAKQQRIFECSEEEASTYLEAVDEVQNLLDQLSVQNKEEEQQPATLERAQNVIQLVMERLEEEFCHFLRITADMWIRIGSLIPWQWLDRSEALSMTIIIIP
jgi:hypothetical protein